MEFPSKFIGNYAVGDFIGNGAYGAVRTGTHRITGTKVAIKTTKKTDVDRLKDYLHEAEIMMLLDHSNIVKLYEVIETVDSIHIVEEYASEGSLGRTLRKNGAMGENEAKPFFRQIVAALHYCHQSGICHRDLKGDNILLDENMTIKLADFGLSKVTGKEGLTKSRPGTLTHSAPELLEHNDKGKRFNAMAADIWSLGVTLFTMVTGKLPFKGKTYEELLHKTKNGRLNLGSNISKECQNLLRGMLTVNPKVRLTIEAVLKHRWMGLNPQQICKQKVYEEGLQTPRQVRKSTIDMDLLDELEDIGYAKEKAIDSILNNNYNGAGALYRLFIIKKRQDPVQWEKERTEYRTLMERDAPSQREENEEKEPLCKVVKIVLNSDDIDQNSKDTPKSLQPLPTDSSGMPPGILKKEKVEKSIEEKSPVSISLEAPTTNVHKTAESRIEETPATQAEEGVERKVETKESTLMSEDVKESSQTNLESEADTSKVERESITANSADGGTENLNKDIDQVLGKAPEKGMQYIVRRREKSASSTGNARTATAPPSKEQVSTAGLKASADDQKQEDFNAKDIAKQILLGSSQYPVNRRVSSSIITRDSRIERRPVKFTSFEKDEVAQQNLLEASGIESWDLGGFDFDSNTKQSDSQGAEPEVNGEVLNHTNSESNINAPPPLKQTRSIQEKVTTSFGDLTSKEKRVTFVLDEGSKKFNSAPNLKDAKALNWSNKKLLRKSPRGRVGMPVRKAASETRFSEQVETPTPTATLRRVKAMSLSKVEDSNAFLKQGLDIDVRAPPRPISSPKVVKDSIKVGKMQQINMKTVHLGMQQISPKRRTSSAAVLPSSVYELNTTSRLSKLLQGSNYFTPVTDSRRRVPK